MADVDGLIIVDKPEGITSHDVVDRARRLLRMKRIGHTGTLDPLATGVLVLLLGKATRLQRFFVDHDKEYLARIRLGLATDTYDRMGMPSGPLIASNGVMQEHLAQALDQWRGSREQLPPMFSAKKQDGVRLYHLARQGHDVPRKPVRITIDELELLEENGEVIHRNPDGTSDFSIRLRCSAGTYVRTLAHDLGQELGCGGHLIELRRAAVGDFRIQDAVRLEEFEQAVHQGQARDCIIPLAHAPLAMPALTLSADDVEKVRHGQAVIGDRALDGVYCKLLDDRGDLIAIGEVVAGWRIIQPRILLC
jgi:tRNA pseudouridine55 synthase